ncbi:ras association domain-containing protein 10 [Kryptolebias marmoratus]|uniref:Ras association domain family member 10 n=1 Tax=Kryptolebias marmoratus TaxID=37003 RepID=A0A3Q2ZWM2_KRYMA|nr:ras association domain-containing protein 10 [Kryptolebias marmoratus]
MESTIEPQKSKISVWVCREEKLVLGLSKRTTCADVVQVLLEEQNAQPGLSTAQSFCIVEKYGGFERILPNKTKILRLWIAWGEEQRNVKFVLVKSDASLENHAARSAEARVVRSKQSPCVTKGTSRSLMEGISPEKQRRVVRKAFRKLEKINKKRTRAAHRDASCAERMETLVHLVISQDHTIRQQIQRITEFDVEIGRRESKVHFDRIKRHGINYVQNTYLDANPAPKQEGDEKSLSETFAKFEVYARQCEEVLRLEEELWEQEALIETITAHIQEELNHRWMLRRKEELRRKQAEPIRGPQHFFCSETDSASQNELFMEKDRIKTQLDASLYIGLRLNADLEAIRGDLELSQQICAAREKEMRDLLEKVNSLDMEAGAGSEERCETEEKTTMTGTLEGKSVWIEQPRGLSKDQSLNDDDSDTGLSSLHSQDSDGLPVWESLV